jgi:ATP-GRASP peptide maturase of grasp-with-spasm system
MLVLPDILINKIMVLIFSQQNDISTDLVIEWLLKENVPFYRINQEYIDVEIKISQEKTTCNIIHNSNKIDLDLVTSVWYRRGCIRFKYFNSDELEHYHINHLKIEAKTIEEYVHFILEKKTCINDPYRPNMNKLIALENAKHVGLNIPKTLIAASNSSFCYSMKNKDIITKPIQDCLYIERNNKFTYLQQTIEINTDDLTEDSVFGLSLFQQKIQKEYELRIFYLNSKIYTAAILPDNELSIDGRALVNSRNLAKRVLPYNAPRELETKIDQFMHSINMNCGSLDFIFSNGIYYFLEVNPVGQYDYLCKLCRFPIDKLIAYTLSNKDLDCFK